MIAAWSLVAAAAVLVGASVYVNIVCIAPCIAALLERILGD